MTGGESIRIQLQAISKVFWISSFFEFDFQHFEEVLIFLKNFSNFSEFVIILN